MDYEIINKQIIGNCRGAIYIDLIHKASEIILTPDTLHEFCNRLWEMLYLSNKDEFIVCFNEHLFMFNDLQSGLIAKDLEWFRIYKENDFEYVDMINPL